MFFTIDSKILIDFFLKNKQTISDITQYKKDKKYKRLLTKLYYDIKEADLYMVNKKMDKCFHKKIIKIETVNDIPKPTIYNSSFFPKNIRNEINIKSTYLLQYQCVIHKRKINLNFILFDDIENIENSELIDTYDKYAYSVYILISMLSTYTTIKCNKVLNIYVYFSDFKKYLPEKTYEIIGPSNVNTGLTIGCNPTIKNTDGEIIIFRKEEWFKVLIHECFHSMDMDFSSMDLSDINKKMYKIFPIDSDFNIFEAYTDVWSRILNSCFVSYNMIDHSRNKEMFIKYSTFLIELESKFSQMQCVKILNFMTLKYENIIDNNASSTYLRNFLYKEKTNVFAYYILSSILFSSPCNFLKWCDENNLSFIRFKNTKPNLESFYKLICLNYNKEEFLSKLRDCERIIKNTILNVTSDKKNNNIERRFFILNTLRMSLVEMA